MKSDSSSNSAKTRAIVSDSAAALSLTEVGLGSLVHALNIPLGGHVLSLNQSFNLSRLIKNLKNETSAPKYSLVASLVAATLKSLSPAGNKFGPMVSIASQGALYSLGVFVFGTSLVGVCAGSALLSLWAFIQPLITLFLLYGTDLVRATDFFRVEIEKFIHISSETLLSLVIAVIAVKIVVSIALAALAWNRSEGSTSVIGFAGFNNATHARDTPLTRTSRVRNAFKQMFTPLFLISFGIMAIFTFLNQRETSVVIWVLLRPLALLFIFYYLRQGPFFFRLTEWLRRLEFTREFFGTLDDSLLKINAAQTQPLGPRVLILGLPGSGKTTLAKMISSNSNRVHIEVDQIICREKGVPKPRPEFEARLLTLLSANAFIVEGHFKLIRPLIEDRISGVIWLDPPQLLVFYRCAKRELKRGGFRVLFSSEGTFRFLLKNHSALREMQKDAFNHLVTSGKVSGRRLLNFPFHKAEATKGYFA